MHKLYICAEKGRDHSPHGREESYGPIKRGEDLITMMRQMVVFYFIWLDPDDVGRCLTVYFDNF